MLRCSDPIFVNIDYGKPILIKNIWWHVCGDFSDVTQYMISDHRFIKVEDRIQFGNLINLVMKILLSFNLILQKRGHQTCCTIHVNQES